MLHIKCCRNWPAGSREEDFLKGFYLDIWAWQPPWSCDQHHVTKFLFPCTWKLSYKIWFRTAQLLLRKFGLIFCMHTAFGPWPSILTYLHWFNYMSAPTNFQVTGCTSFWKIHSFHFFLWKSPNYKIWHCCKRGQDQPEVIILIINYDGLESPKLQRNRPTGSGEEDFWRVFTIYGRGGHLGHVTQSAVNKLSSPYPRRLHIKFGFDWHICFRGKDLWALWTTTTDGRTDGRTTTKTDGRMDAGPWVSYMIRLHFFVM